MSKADALPPVYVAGRVKHEGKIVPVGTRLDEAREWKYFSAFVNSGLFVVGENAEEGLVSTEPTPSPSPAEAEEPAESDAEASSEAEVDVALDQSAYDALTVEEVAGLLEDGTLSQDDVLAFESEREGGVRKGVERLLDA